MSNEDPQDVWDFVIVGGGPPGENVAQYAIQGSDRSAVIVESQLVGGECSYWACMPSKALLRPLQVLATAQHQPGLSSVVGDRRIDVAALLAHRDSVVHHHSDESQLSWAAGAGIDVVRGHGRLAGTRCVEVTTPSGTTRRLYARHAVVLATGTTATVPAVPGLAEALPWTSRDVTNLHEVPRRMVVLGGGVVACEAATWLTGLGVETLTLVASGDRLLARNEPFAGELVLEELTARGVIVHLQSRVDRVSRPAAEATDEGQVHGGPARVWFGSDSDSDGGEVEVDELLVAAGRTPASADLGLQNVPSAGRSSLAEAAAANRGYLVVDDHLAVEGVAGDWLYAVGDLNGRALLTHMGKYQGRICGEVLAARAEGRSVAGPRRTDLADHGLVPQVTFTDPEVASVGRTEREARAAGVDVETVEYDMAALAGTYLLRSDYRGRAKLVIDRAADTLVGATFVGPEVADLVHAATVAIVGGVTLERLWHAVPSYPTPSEVWLRLLEAREPAG